MKRLLILAVAAALLASGCAANGNGNTVNVGPTSPASASPSPSPTPPPEGVESVFKKNIKVALVTFSDGENAFFTGAEEQAKLLGIETVRVTGTSASAITGAGADAVVCYKPGASDVSALSTLAAAMPVAVFTDQSANVPQGASSVIGGGAASEDAAVQAVMDALMAYPPHDAPVRILALHTAKDSVGDKLCNTLYGAGKLIRRGMYYQNTETTAESWATTALTSTFVAGTLDAIYADNAELALAAYKALKQSDHYGVEIFCPTLNAAILTAMVESPKLFVGAVGVNEIGAGALCFRMATSTLHGAQPSQEPIESKVILAGETTADGIKSFITLDGMGDLCHEDWMDYLEEYYSAANTPMQSQIPETSPGTSASPEVTGTPAVSATPAA